MRRPVLIVMVKEPRPGRVKTRLGREIGMVSAAWWFRHQTRRILRLLRDPRWQLMLAVTPDREGLESRVWPPDLPRIAQGRGDLGQRMARALCTVHGPAILIGADIPEVGRDHIARAFVALGSSLSVIGPAADGGFWLVGLRHPERATKELFANVRWSQEQTFADTVPMLPSPVAVVDTLTDVDNAADLAQS